MGRELGTFHENGEEVAPEVIVLTVTRARAGPFFKVRVTGPEAPAQLMGKDCPAVTV